MFIGIFILIFLGYLYYYFILFMDISDEYLKKEIPISDIENQNQNENEKSNYILK
jgi:sugar phosphate permease